MEMTTQALDEQRTADAGSSRRSTGDGPKQRLHSHQARKYLDLKERHRQLRRVFLALSIGLVLLSTALGGLAMTETRKQRSLDADLYKQRAALRDAQAALEKAQQELAALVQGRIPSLHPMVLDEVVRIGEEYVRNVAFTQVRQ